MPSNIIFTNCRSVVNKVNDLEIECCQIWPEIIALCETWLTKDLPNSLINFNGRYQVFRKDRDSRGRGVGLMILNSFSTRIAQIQLPTIYNQLEIIAVDIEFDNIKTRIMLCYRPSGSGFD